jgi:4-hydroxybenzoate polyprenyltransferase
MSQIPAMTPLNLMPLFLLIGIILGLSTFKIFFSELFTREWKAFPYTRLWHYLFLYFWSVKIFLLKTGLPSQEIFFDVINLICLFIAAVFLNHYFDNQFLGKPKEKPLFYGSLFFNFLGLAFVQNVFFQILGLLMVGCAFLYETPPFRLKRYWAGSILCLGLISMAAFLAPLVINQVNPFSTSEGLWLILPVVISFLIPIKDLKDEQIDQKMGTKTLVHLWGVKKLRSLIAVGITGLFLLGAVLFKLSLRD